jgi:hypothetical protein
MVPMTISQNNSCSTQNFTSVSLPTQSMMYPGLYTSTKGVVHICVVRAVSKTLVRVLWSLVHFTRCTTGITVLMSVSVCIFHCSFVWVCVGPIGLYMLRKRSVFTKPEFVYFSRFWNTRKKFYTWFYSPFALRIMCSLKKIQKKNKANILYVSVYLMFHSWNLWTDTDEPWYRWGGGRGAKR